MGQPAAGKAGLIQERIIDNIAACMYFTAYNYMVRQRLLLYVVQVLEVPGKQGLRSVTGV
jgi:hypothetical protein